MVGVDAKSKTRDDETSREVKSRDEHPSCDEKAPIVEVVADGGDQIEPPPPEIVELHPKFTPEEAEQARKSYLLARFYISARGSWRTKGDRLAWLFSIAPLILI